MRKEPRSAEIMTFFLRGVRLYHHHQQHEKLTPTATSLDDWCNGAYQQATDATNLIQEELENGNTSETKLRHQANRMHTMAKKVNDMAWRWHSLTWASAQALVVHKHSGVTHPSDDKRFHPTVKCCHPWCIHMECCPFLWRPNALLNAAIYLVDLFC